MNLIEYTVKIPDTDMAREAVDAKVIDIIDAHERAEDKRLKDMPKPKDVLKESIESGDSIAENYEGMGSNEEKPARKRRTKAEMEASDK